MKKQQQVFLSEEDEVELNRKLKEVFPDLRYLDGNRWRDGVVHVANSIRECQSFHVYLWNGMEISEIPTRTLKDGTIVGPQAGIVVQFSRSRLCDNCLLSGRIALGADKENVQTISLYKTVLSIIRDMSVCSLNLVDPETDKVLSENVTTYWASAGARKLVEDGGATRLKACNSKLYFSVPS